jgi:UDP-N-acetylmuramoyl-tripeptide--D-alanyl-D-alanine ligase
MGLFGSTCDIHNSLIPASSDVVPMEDVFSVSIPLPGGHMVLNALAATAVGSLLGLTKDEIRSGIAAVKPLGGRSNIIRHHKYTIIDDCYNANPVSMKAAIDLLNMASTRKVAILGDMFELGTAENSLHKGVGEYAAAKDVDVLICVGKLSLHMYEGAISVNPEGNTLQKSRKVLYYETRDELIHVLPDILEQNDTILVKASHGMGFDEVVKALTN